MQNERGQVEKKEVMYIRALERGSLEDVKSLVDRGMHPDMRLTYFFNYTPLHAAISNKDTNILELLLDKAMQLQSDIDIIDGKDKITPLLRAGRFGSIEHIRLLIQYGADLTITDQGNRDLIKYMKLYHRDVLIPEVEAIIKAHGSSGQRLLTDKSAELTDRSKRNRNPSFLNTERQPVKSRINENFVFNAQVWVISILNAESKVGRRSILVVEGLNKTSTLELELFVGHYDIVSIAYSDQENSINVKDYISQVRIFEGKDYGRDYSKYQAKSHYSSPQKLAAMIASIHEDAQKINKLQEMIRGEIDNDKPFVVDSNFIKKNGFLKYQLLGGNSLFSNKEAGYNSAEWVLEKLTIAGIDEDFKTKPAANGCNIF